MTSPPHPSGLRLRILAHLLAAASLLPAGDVAGCYSFRSYGPDQGLRNQAVNGLAQDKEGFLYVGTDDGLFRYDGSRFERFGTEQGLPSSIISLVYREPGGRLWLATSRGLIAWGPGGMDPGMKAPLLSGEVIISLCSSESGNLVVGTSRGVFEGGPGGMAPLKGLESRGSCSAWISVDGSEILVANQGRLHYRNSHGSWECRNLAPAFQVEPVQTVLKDRTGRIWVRGRHTLLRLSSYQGAIEDLSPLLPGAAEREGPLLLDDRDRVWAPTNRGLLCFEGKDSWVISEAQGLPNQIAVTALVDREGSLWVGSEGVHRLQGRLLWSAQTHRQGLPSDIVWSLLRDRKGQLWAGTSRGLGCADHRTWQTIPDTRDRAFYAMAEDADGGLWTGGNCGKDSRNRLLYKPPGASSFQSIPLQSLKDPTNVNGLAFGPDGLLYIATTHFGLHRLVRHGREFRSESVPLPMGTSQEGINQLFRDPRGHLWATAMNGLVRYDGTHWRRFGPGDGLLEAAVDAMAMAPDGELWVSYLNIRALTRLRLDARGNAVCQQVREPSELVGDSIYSMGFDAKGTLWLGTAQGINRWKDGHLEHFGRGEGLPSEDAADNAFLADQNGDVWLGMANALMHFHADRDQSPPPLPITRLMHVRNGAGRLLDETAPRVAWKDRTLTFQYSALSFLNEDRIHYQVRLTGFEDAWRDTRIREARYTGLPPGSYTFEVRATLGLEAFGPISRREVIILAPWWRTGWAYASAFVLLAGLLAILYRWRLGWLQRHNALLKSLVQERTRELEEANLALKEASVMDPLTGLKNRRYLDLAMPEELARLSRQRRDNLPSEPSANANQDLLFFMVDLDHFKSVNDTYGHAAGDMVLRQASEAIRAACRESDIVVRWGGEEFLIVARSTDRSAAEVVARNLWRAIRELSFEVGHGVTLRKTGSIGFSAFPVLKGSPDLYSWEQAVELADQCLFAAKNSGRDGWVGVLISEETDGEGERLLLELGELAAQNRVQVMTSFPDGTPIRWN